MLDVLETTSSGVLYGSGGLSAGGSAEFRLTPLPEGDFDHNGVVDGVDYLKWQRGESPDPLSQSDLADWDANYGTVAPLAAASTAVPEPATCVVLLCGMMAMLFRRESY